MVTELREPLVVSVPLHLDEQATYRVGGTRITLDVLVEDFENGHSPEWIAQNYRTLHLADVYAVIAWYLKHADEAKSYLKRREREAEEIRQRIAASQPERPGLRAELLARRVRMEQGHATPGK